MIRTWLWSVGLLVIDLWLTSQVVPVFGPPWLTTWALVAVILYAAAWPAGMIGFAILGGLFGRRTTWS
jgi:hypothetical protein